jgi:uncharacterized protein (DUF1778 family)
MPRPALPKHQLKRVLIQLRLTSEEKSLLIFYAKSLGLTITDFVKSRTLHKPPRIKKANFDREVLIRLLSELGKIGSNLNQIAKFMNSQKTTFYSVTVKEAYIVQVLSEVQQLSDRILKELDNGQSREFQGERVPVGDLPADQGRE